MRVVVALGGNALLRRGEPLEAGLQRERLRIAAAVLAQIAADHALVVTHGNGPQVGLLALQAEAYKEVKPYPLDVLGAESEGMIGYMIEQELASRLPGREIATLLTQVEVDPADPAFKAPSKPIGPIYTEDAARRLTSERGWAVARDGEGFRRIVASPQPERIRELNAIRLLVEAGVIVICAGGGGIPVIATLGGGLKGVEAVIDKDLASGLLAENLGVDTLLMLTDVSAVYADWPRRAKPLRAATPETMRTIAFEPGSMGPKVAAACRFVERTGGVAAIGALADAAAILRREAGTVIVRSA